MERLNALAEGLKHVARLLAEDVLEPDPSRTDWAGMTVRVGMARQGMEQVLADLEGALEEAEDAASKALVRHRVAEVAGRLAALLYSADDFEGFRHFIEAAVGLSEDPAQRARFEAGLAEPDCFCLHEYAVWARGRGRHELAEALYRQVADKSRQKPLKDLARHALRGLGSRPLHAAPPLVRINGCGVGLYGKRDEAPDGTYVATYFISLLFLPVFPLTAYRVRDEDGRAYQFLSKEPLGPVARVWQRLMLVGVVGALVWAGVDRHLHDPSRLARQALDEARTAEATLSREESLQRYRSVIGTHEDAAVRAQAAQAVVRLSLAGLPTPCTPGTVEAVGRVVAGTDSLPAESVQGEPLARLAERLDRCAQEIGQASAGETRAALAVVEAARRVARAHPALTARHEALSRTLADQLLLERPLQSLALYARLPGDEARDAAHSLLDSLGEAPSLWLEASESLEVWLARGDLGPRSADAERYRVRLAGARATHARDQALIAGEAEAKLLPALKASPGNQELTVAVATLALGRGDVAVAAALLEALGPVGRLTGEAQWLLAVCHRDRGQLAEADAVLSSYIAERLAPFQQAQREYEREAQALREQLVSQAQKGRIPEELETRLQVTFGEEARGQLFREWLSERLEQDPRLEKLRAAYLRHQPVVSASLILGMVKIQRAQAAEGEARHALLGEAERVFLAIREQAEDDPSFLLGLGQVYHRLGRNEEGDAALHGVVERGDPELTLRVAEVYRELDRIDEARRLFSGVYDTAGDEDLKHQAASSLSLLAADEDEDEREAWLRKSDVSSPVVQDHLLRLQASRALREGRLEEADQLLGRYVAQQAREARRDTAAANNTALALMERFEATGDPEHLRAAVRSLEDAVRLAPTNALVVGNLAGAREYLGHVSVLEHWVRTQPLRPSPQEAETLVDVLLEGPLRSEVLRVLDAEPSLRRGQALGQQEQALAPGKASAWERRLRWLRQHRDERGLAALARQLEPLPPFGGGSNARSRREWESGTADERFGRSMARAVASAEATLWRAQRTNHAPTIATAWHLLGGVRVNQHHVAGTPEQLEAMVDAYRQALGLWPVLSASGDLEAALTLAAVEHGVAKSEALAKVWKAEQRTLGMSSLVYRALTGPGGTEVAEVLRAQPELREAAEHARRRAPSTPRMADWVLARAAGDVVLEQAAAALFSRPDVELTLALDARLAGDHRREQSARELFQQARAAGAAREAGRPRDQMTPAGAVSGHAP